MDIMNPNMKANLEEAPEPFDFISSKLRAPILISCPHSGRHYPAELINQTPLSLENLRESEDAYIDQICAELPNLGVNIICANYARSYIDLNRSPDILDNRIIEGAAHTSCLMTNSGFGIIPRIVGVGREIYKNKISLKEALNRIEAIHRPYHQKITEAIDALSGVFGRALLLDMHSMPNSSLGSIRADIILGDRFSTSCRPEITEFIECQLQSHGLKVRRNHPFAGGYTTINYGKPKLSQDALQIEINRSLYMNEANLKPHEGFEKIKMIIGSVVKNTIDLFNCDK